MSMSDYEKQRLENIKENEALLRQLEIHNIGRTKTKKTPLKQHKPIVKKEPKLPSRTSARIRGEPPKRHLDLDGTPEPEVKKPKIIESLGSDDQEKFLGLMKKTLIPNTTPKVTVKQEPNDEGKTPDQILQNQLSELKIHHEWATVKVTPSRTNGCLFHPSDSKILACAIDVDGHLGFWDVKSQDEEGEPVVYSYKPHRRNISDFHFNPVDHSKLLTSSYDGLIRTFDMNKAVFDTWTAKEEYPITNFSLSQDGHNIWFCTSDGDVGMKDNRTDKKETVYNIRDKKVGTIDLNSVHEHLLAAGSNDRTCTIWDIRMWNRKAEPLQSLEHGYSVTGCAWSPKGDMLVTTAYDDYIRLFTLNKDIQTVELKSAIPHNNHTGRWVTNFRARWNANPNGLETQHFVIGNMKQTIDIYSGETGKEIVQLYDEDHITAISGVCQFHPSTTQPMVLAGNASGRMLCYD